MTTFVDAEIPTDDIPRDYVPELSDIEYPCEVCGREAGPYGGRGRKPKRCDEHKRHGVKATKVGGNAGQLAVQATAALVQVNGIIATIAMATGLFETAGAIAKANGPFEQQALAALSTDPDLCRLILKTGQKSSRLALGMAYAGMGMLVVPTAAMELKEKKRLRDERKAAEDDA